MSMGPGRADGHLGRSGRRRHPPRSPLVPRRCRRSADLPSGPEQVVDEQHPDEVVEVVAVDREAAVPRLAHGLGDGVDGQRDGEGHHVHPGRHDLADHGVVEVVERVDDELLLGIGAALGLATLRRPLSVVPGPVGGPALRPAADRLVRGVGTRTRS